MIGGYGAPTENTEQWVDEDGTVHGGHIDGAAEHGGGSAVEEFSSPSNPMAVARQILPDWQEGDVATLRHWRGSWMRWERSYWREVDDKEIRSALYARLEHAVYVALNSKTGEWEQRNWSPTKRKIGDLVEATAAIIHLTSSIDPPTWTEQTINAHGTVVACANGLLHVDTRELLDLDPRFFNRVAVPFDYDPHAPVPARWLAFLAELWTDDPDSIAALREWFGYVLSGRTDLHKIMLLIGPTRSGKGTIARVLEALIGTGNAAGPTLASLGTNFGLSPLLGKPLAVVSDARLGGANVHQVVERLLSVSGEDMLTVDRKYRDPWTGKLPTRFMLLSNELPRFGDASGAIANRFVVLAMEKSFLGKENPGLTRELLGELPGILRWALDGLDQLGGTDTFTTPATSRDAVVALQDLVSPVAAFVRDWCTVGAGREIPAPNLFAAWRSWCEDNGHRPGTQQNFGRDLRAVIPALRVVRPRSDDPTQTRRPRSYQGVDLDESETHNGEARGPSRTGPPPHAVDPFGPPVVHGGPRPNPLWVQHHEDG